MANGYTWEAIGSYAEDARDSGIHKVEEQEACIRQHLPTPQESPWNGHDLQVRTK